MIGYLRGTVAFLYTDRCLLDVNGVGYRVFVPASTHNLLKTNESAELFIHTAVREDAILLYGFATRGEYDVFNLLISVSGIGAKVALNVLSAMPAAELTRAIAQKNATLLTKLPGIGKKSAERIILELKDKITLGEQNEGNEGAADAPPADDLAAETTAALTALGYSRAEIAPALKKIGAANSVQAAIKLALKELARKQ